MAPWLKAVVNHMYWYAASSTAGDGEMIATKWASLANHLFDENEGHSEIYLECTHDPLDGPNSRQWLKLSKQVFIHIHDYNHVVECIQ